MKGATPRRVEPNVHPIPNPARLNDHFFLIAAMLLDDLSDAAIRRALPFLDRLRQEDKRRGLASPSDGQLGGVRRDIRQRIQAKGREQNPNLSRTTPGEARTSPPRPVATKVDPVAVRRPVEPCDPK